MRRVSLAAAAATLALILGGSASAQSVRVPSSGGGGLALSPAVVPLLHAPGAPYIEGGSNLGSQAVSVPRVATVSGSDEAGTIFLHTVSSGASGTLYATVYFASPFPGAVEVSLFGYDAVTIAQAFQSRQTFPVAIYDGGGHAIGFEVQGGATLNAEVLWTFGYVVRDATLGSPSLLAISSPSAFQVVQQSAGVATISISGTVGAGKHDIEASVDGSHWSRIATGASGSFSGTLSSVPAGQYALRVRWRDYPAMVAIVSPVSVSDVGAMLGQSNAVGQGINRQVYTHGTVRASLYGLDRNWRQLLDPTHDATNQVGTLPNNGANIGGGFWAQATSWLLANSTVIGARGIGWIPCAEASSDITSAPGGLSWAVPVNHLDTTTLYGNALVRIRAAGGARFIVWMQGETEASVGTSTAVYLAAFTSIVQAFKADIPGVKFFAVLLHSFSGATAPHIALINAAFTQALSANTIDGTIDFTGLSADAPDAFHFTEDATLTAAGNILGPALKSGMGW